MPITILPPNNQVSMPIGPGSQLVAHTDFIGPLPVDASWILTVSSDPEGAHQVLVGSLTSDAHQVFMQLGTTAFQWGWTWPGLAGLAEGQSAHVSMELHGQNNVLLDTGTASFPWSLGAAGAAYQSSQTTGFTSEDRAVLQTIDAWTVVDTFITSLTLESMGSAPPGGQLAVSLTEWRYGIIVRLTQIPPDLQPQTPDLDYWVKTLAVVRIFRGTDILQRIPIHRSSQIIPFEGNGMILTLARATIDLWAPGLSVEVDFGPGVAGEALLMKLP